MAGFNDHPNHVILITPGGFTAVESGGCAGALGLKLRREPGWAEDRHTFREIIQMIPGLRRSILVPLERGQYRA